MTWLRGTARTTKERTAPWVSIYTPRGSVGFPPGRSRGIKGQWGASGKLPRGWAWFVLRRSA